MSIFSPKLKDKVIESLGLKHLLSGGYVFTDLKTDVKDDDTVLYLWCAEIYYFHRYLSLIVGSMKSVNHQRGIILLPNPETTYIDKETGLEFVAERKFQNNIYVNVNKNWLDPVHQALQTIDLRHRNTKEYRSRSYYAYRFFVDTQTIECEFSCRLNDNDLLTNFWKALLSATEHFTDLYNDPNIREFMGPHGFEWPRKSI